jgi:hypothetical protein
MTLTFQDCVSPCDLSEAEILAIAEHEKLPAIAALGSRRRRVARRLATRARAQVDPARFHPQAPVL